MSEHIHLISHVTDDSFDDEVKLASLTQPVLVDFWAEWCGPCRMIAPLLDQLVTEHGERLKIVKLNVDENPRTPAMLGIRGIPTMMLFKGGELAATHVGAVPKSKLSAFIEPYLQAA